MNIHTYPPLSFCALGQRTGQEDCILHLSPQQLYIVSDGMGGHSKGEVASQLTCQAVAQYFEQNPARASTPVYMEQVLQAAQSGIDSYLAQQPDAKGMGCTLALLHLHTQGASIAHVGDSRVYHIRHTDILHQTQDHSFVNELVLAGVITVQDAKTHSKRNVITRAIQGNSVKSTEIEFSEINDLKANDYFFICTDGVTESIDNQKLLQILSHPQHNNQQKVDEILQICGENSRDNHSGYLLQIQSIETEENDLPTQITPPIESLLPDVVLVDDLGNEIDNIIGNEPDNTPEIQPEIIHDDLVEKSQEKTEIVAQVQEISTQKIEEEKSKLLKNIQKSGEKSNKNTDFMRYFMMILGVLMIVGVAVFAWYNLNDKAKKTTPIQKKTTPKKQKNKPESTVVV